MKNIQQLVIDRWSAYVLHPTQVPNSHEYDKLLAYNEYIITLYAGENDGPADQFPLNSVVMLTFLSTMTKEEKGRFRFGLFVSSQHDIFYDNPAKVRQNIKKKKK